MISPTQQLPDALGHFGKFGGSFVPETTANITIFDPNKEWVVDVNKFVSLGKNTPLAGAKLTGKVVATIYQGNLIYKDDSINIGLR